MGEAEQSAEPPTRIVDGSEQPVVGEGEDEAETEVQQVADGFGAAPVGTQPGAEQEPGWFEQRTRVGGGRRRSHSGVDDRKQDVDQRRAGEQAM